METIKIKCSICRYNYLSELPSILNKREMNKIEKNYACNNCIDEGRRRRKATADNKG